MAPVAAAAEAVVLRTTAPGTPAGMRVSVGQMLSIPEGAAVTVLFRDGRLAVLRGAAEGGVRVPAPKTVDDAAEAFKASFAAPAPRRVFGATRAPEDALLEDMRRGRFPEGDYVDQAARGCTSALCRALQAYVDEATPRSLFVRVLTGGAAPTAELRADFDATPLCWAFDPAAGVRRLEPSAATLTRNGAAIAEAGARVEKAAATERFIGCAAPAPGQETETLPPDLAGKVATRADFAAAAASAGAVAATAAY